jgi:uncharacterized membrane protein
MSAFRITRRLALAAYAGLMVVVVSWELALAPVTPLPRVFWAALKLAPLLIPLYGLLRGSARAHLLAGLLVLFYFSEGIALTYAMARHGTMSQWMCMLAETVTALGFILAATFYARFSAVRASAPTPE